MSQDEIRAEFEAVMRAAEPSFKPELMQWINGRYEFDTMESAWHGFSIGFKAGRAIPPGYALVPVEPTEAMIEAAEEAYMPFGAMELAYSAMLAAAPKVGH